MTVYIRNKFLDMTDLVGPQARLGASKLRELWGSTLSSQHTYSEGLLLWVEDFAKGCDSEAKGRFVMTFEMFSLQWEEK